MTVDKNNTHSPYSSKGDLVAQAQNVKTTMGDAVVFNGGNGRTDIGIEIPIERHKLVTSNFLKELQGKKKEYSANVGHVNSSDKAHKTTVFTNRKFDDVVTFLQEKYGVER